MVLKAHFDGESIVLDDPIPEDLPPNSPVTVSYEPGGGGILREIAEMARPAGLPHDFVEQHSHYTKGSPRR